LKIDFKRLASVEQYSEVSGRKYVGVANRPKKGWTEHVYQKNFDLYLDLALKDLNKELISWITERNQILLSDVSNWTVVIEDVIFEMNKYLAIMLFDYNSNEYSKDPRIISNINRINKNNINEFISNKNRNVMVLYNKIKDIYSMELLESKINKLSQKDSPLFKMLEELLKSNINQVDKQITIEKALVEYDVRFFKEHIDNSSNQIKIFNQEYENILKKL
jgi:hypothetical protein